jgi:predicted transcriptional regulator
LVVNLLGWTWYNPHREGLQTVLSPAEAEIILIMWREKRATARTVQTLLGGKNKMKRSTVNATMKSLCKRGLLSSSITKGRGGLKYVYRVRVSRRMFEREVVGKVLKSLFKSYGKTAKKILDEKYGGSKA